MNKKWFILYESGGLLSRSGDRITYFYDQAMSFRSRAEARMYMVSHQSAVNCAGLRPLLTEAA